MERRARLYFMFQAHPFVKIVTRMGAITAIRFFKETRRENALDARLWAKNA
jgi:hypothetical protein